MVNDYPDKELGKAIPYGVHDRTQDAGRVSVGVDHDTASFAVETLRRWWRRTGCVSYPVARRLLITADGGGSNGSRNRLWKANPGERLSDVNYSFRPNVLMVVDQSYRGPGSFPHRQPFIPGSDITRRDQRGKVLTTN